MEDSPLALLSSIESTRSEALLNVLLEQQSQINRLLHTVAAQSSELAALRAEVADIRSSASFVAAAPQSTAAAPPAKEPLSHDADAQPAAAAAVAPIVIELSSSSADSARSDRQRGGDDENGGPPPSDASTMAPSSTTAGAVAAADVAAPPPAFPPPAAAAAASPKIRWPGVAGGAPPRRREFVPSKRKPPTLPRSMAASATTTPTEAAPTAPPPLRATTGVAPAAATSATAARATQSEKSEAPANPTSETHRYCLSAHGALVAPTPVGVDVQVTCVAASCDGRCVVSGTSDGRLHLWAKGGRARAWTHMREMAACPVQQQVEEETPGEARRTEVLDLALQQTLLLVGASDGSVRAWRARAVVEAPAALSAGVAEADDTDEDIDAELYPLRCFDGRCAVVNGVQAGVQCVALPPQDNGASSELAEWPWAVPRQFAASGGQDGLLRIWDVESGAELQKIRFGPKVKKSGKAKKGVSGCWVTGVALARPRDACSRPLAFSGSSDGAVVIWAACSVEDSSAAPSSFFSQAMVLQGPSATAGSPLSTIACSGDGRYVVAGHYDGTLRVWAVTLGANTEAGVLTTGGEPINADDLADAVRSSLSTLEGKVQAVAFRGMDLIACGEDGACCVMQLGADATSQTRVSHAAGVSAATRGCGETYSVACGARGEVFIATAAGGLVCLLD